MKGLLGAPLIVTGGVLWAQDTGGLIATFDISQRLEHIEEEGFTASDDEGLRSLTTLGFGLSSETRSQSLRFGVSTGIAQNLTNGGSTEFEDTRVSLDYGISNRNTELTIGALYRRDEIDDLAFDTELLDDDIDTGDGQREIFSLTTSLTVGADGPVTGTLTHTYEKSTFSDTTDPTLNDSDTQRIDGRLSFRVAPNLETSIFAGWSEVDEDGVGATDRTTSNFGIGATYDITPATTLTGEISYSEEESRGTTVEETDGLNYAFSLAHLRPNGSISFRFSETDTLNGARREAAVARSFVLPRGELSFAIGATKTDGFDVQPLVNVSVDYAIDRNSNLLIVLEQSGDINSDDEEVVNTRFDLSYTRELTSLSEISAGVELANENVLGVGGIDQRSVRADLTHSYELGDDWDLVSGYEYSSVEEDGEPTRKRNIVFLGLQKSFSFRP